MWERHMTSISKAKTGVKARGYCPNLTEVRVEGSVSKSDSSPETVGDKAQTARGVGSLTVQGSNGQEPQGESRGGMEYTFESVCLWLVDGEIKKAYVERVKRLGCAVDLDLLLRAQSVLQLNTIVELLTKLNDASKGGGTGGKSDDSREPV
jgi:hypothetical protein